MNQLTEELLLSWWRLSKVYGVGPATLNKIRHSLPSPQALLDLNEQQLLEIGLSTAAIKSWHSDSHLSNGFEQIRQWRTFEKSGVLLAGVDPYPEALASLSDAPTFLFYRGNLEALSQPKIAMVGSRNATPYALNWTHKTAAELASQQITVVSGLALGIDGASHKGALETGSTIAVLGSGLDVIYPQRHQSLANEIIKEGLLLSEFLPGTIPQPQNFPSRNRIVSGLSLGVLVVEAAIKSGSLITARLAADQGREVFALPGAVTNPLSHGCHQLIRDGAILVRNADDVIQELELAAGHQLDLLEPKLRTNIPQILSFIDFTATSLDQIAIRSKKTMAELLPELLELELQGWLTQVPNGYQRVK